MHYLSHDRWNGYRLMEIITKCRDIGHLVDLADLYWPFISVVTISIEIIWCLFVCVCAGPGKDQEELRRKVENGVKELWYFVRSELKKLALVDTGALQKHVDTLLQDLGHQQRLYTHIQFIIPQEFTHIDSRQVCIIKLLFLSNVWGGKIFLIEFMYKYLKNEFLWWQSWIFSSYNSSLQCHMILQKSFYADLLLKKHLLLLLLLLFKTFVLLNIFLYTVLKKCQPFLLT